MKDLDMMHYFIGMEVWQNVNLSWIREVCSGDPKEVKEDGMQGHDHAHGIKLEAVE